MTTSCAGYILFYMFDPTSHNISCNLPKVQLTQKNQAFHGVGTALEG